MSLIKSIGVLGNSLKQTSHQITAVRFAKIIQRPTKYHYEFTNAALWRKSRGGYSNPNRYGPLTNAPDYSYLDGRPVPLGINLRSRMEQQQKYAERITHLSGEIDFARERYREKRALQESSDKQRIDNKLKRKGTALLKNGTT